MYVTVRYDVRRDYGGKGLETRRNFNLRFSQPNPEVAFIPATAGYLWEWFWQLASQRSEVNPIGFSAIKAWSDLMGNALRPWEVNALIKMDDAAIRTHHEEAAYVAALNRDRSKVSGKR